MNQLVASILFLFLISNLSSIICRPIPLKTEPALLVISYDAFRPDYFNRNVTPNLNKFRKEGTSAEYMFNVFPTKTFVNHFTIATGLHADSHGVLSNDLYDRKLGKYIKYGYELFHYSNETVPIWTANEKAGKNSGCMMWPGSDFDYNGINCTFTGVFDFDYQWKDRVDTALSWFRDEKTPANFVMLYIEDPDEHGHAYGPESNTVTEMVAKLDDLTGYIQKQLTELGLDKRVNVIHLSDHGMNTVVPPDFIDLRKFVVNGTCEMYGTSPVIQVVPNDGKEDEVFTRLTKAAKENGHFKIYNEKNIPARWHANNTMRLGPIIAVADIGYGFQDLWDYAEYFKKKYGVPITNESQYGVHGYDNDDPSMHAIFMAKGPLFQKGKTLKPVNMIDLYNLFCSILNINCPPNHGSTKSDTWNELFAVKPVKDIRRNKEPDTSLIIAGIIFVAVIVAVVIYARVRHHRREHALLRNHRERSTVILKDFEHLDDEAFNQSS